MEIQLTQVDPIPFALGKLLSHGKYFESVPIKIKAIPKLGYAFSHWSDESLLFYENLDLNNPEISVDLKHYSKFKAHFKVAPLNIEKTSFVDEVYPNPTDSKIKINLKQGVNIKDLYFIDLNGKKLVPKEYLRNKNTLEINVSNLVIGIYILQVESDREINKVKIIIER